MTIELLNGLTEEQIAKVKACKSQEELLKLTKEEGVELTDEQLEAVNGGCGTPDGHWGCPYCGCGWAMSIGFPRLHCVKCGNDYNNDEKKYYQHKKD